MFGITFVRDDAKQLERETTRTRIVPVAMIFYGVCWPIDCSTEYRKSDDTNTDVTCTRISSNRKNWLGTARTGNSCSVCGCCRED